jgi:hypothetical protein
MVGLSRACDDGRENAIERGAERRVGFGRQFGWQAMAADADPQTDAGKGRRKLGGHVQHQFLTAQT